MRSDSVVQRGLRTPTGPFFARFFIGIILGLVAEFAFMGQSIVHALPELQFAVVEVGAGPSVIAALRSAVDMAGPCPLGPVVRCPVAEHDPAD